MTFEGTLDPYLNLGSAPLMEQLVAISAVDGDRTSIVRDLTRLILDCGGNIKESRMTALGSKFAMLLLV